MQVTISQKQAVRFIFLFMHSVDSFFNAICSYVASEKNISLAEASQLVTTTKEPLFEVKAGYICREQRVLTKEAKERKLQRKLNEDFYF